MIKVAVITAPNRSNTGMVSVDLAAESFFNDKAVAFDLYRTHTVDNKDIEKFSGQQFYRLKDPGQLKDYDVICYWGDFLNSPAYGQEDFFGLDQRDGICRDREESFKRWMRLCLLDGYDKGCQRVISVSNNFQGMASSLSRMGTEERSSVCRLLEHNFDAIFPRDPVSTEMLVKHCPRAAKGNIRTGVDAAFLLDSHSFVPDDGRTWSARSFSYFFGRSGITGLSQLLLSLGLHFRAFPSELEGWLSVTPEREGWEQLSAFLCQVSRSQFVVTDTYHLCVNAMNLGVPVVGVGRYSDEQEGTLGDYKKQTLFQMFGQKENYIAIQKPRLSSEDRRSVRQAVRRLLSSSNGAVSASSRIRARVQAYKAELEASLFGGHVSGVACQ